MLFIDEIEKTKILTTTSCCRTISYVNAPLFVYENLDSYKGVSNTDLYVYTYSIQISPGGTFSVFPIVFVGGTLNITNDAVVSPTSSTFSNTKSQLRSFLGSFIITGTPGTYRILFSLTGGISKDRSIYDLTRGINVSILPDLYDPPFPTLQSARFGNSGSTISVLFDSPTDQAAHYSSTLKTKIPSLFKCDLVFLFKSSSFSTCTWNNDSSLVVSFDSSSSVEFLNIGDSISFRQNVIKAACKKTHNTTRCNNYLYAPNSKSVLVLSPLNPLRPNVVITAPKILSACDDFIIDASSSSGN